MATFSRTLGQSEAGRGMPAREEINPKAKDVLEANGTQELSELLVSYACCAMTALVCVSVKYNLMIK